MTTPTREGFYWAKWRIAAEGTVEGDELTPSNDWEVVQVNDNNGEGDEAFSVSVPGVEKPQWLPDFVWGPGPLVPPAARSDAATLREAARVLRAGNDG